MTVLEAYALIKAYAYSLGISTKEACSILEDAFREDLKAQGKNPEDVTAQLEKMLTETGKCM